MRPIQIHMAPGSQELADWINERQARRVKLKMAHIDGNELLAELAQQHAIIMYSVNDHQDPVAAAHAARAMLEFIILYGYELGLQHGKEGIDLDAVELPPEIAEEIAATAAKMQELRDRIDREQRQATADRNRDVV